MIFFSSTELTLDHGLETWKIPCSFGRGLITANFLVLKVNYGRGDQRNLYFSYRARRNIRLPDNLPQKQSHRS